MNSIVEAASSAVPIIAIPLFAGIFFGLKLSVFRSVSKHVNG
jgi:hypothetical protein